MEVFGAHFLQLSASGAQFRCALREQRLRLRQFRFEWPTFDAAFGASVLRWLMLFVAVAGLLWLVSLVARRRQERKTQAAD